MKDKINEFVKYKEKSTLQLIKKIEDNEIMIESLNDVQINNLINYYVRQIVINKNKLETMRKEVKKI